MTDELFARLYEKKIHILISAIALSGACSSIATGIYNTSATGSFCGIANTPTGCNQQPDIYGECDAQVSSYVKFFSLVSFCVSSTSILIIVLSMAGLVHFVLTKDRQYGDRPTDPSEEQLQQYKLRKYLLRETMIQAIMYVAGWFVSQVPPMIGGILLLLGTPLEKMPSWFRIFASMSYPLTNAFNIFIFTRPAIRHIRRVDTSVSWYRAFHMVLQSGGQVPSDFQRQRSEQQQQQQQHVRRSMSSREAYGATTTPHQYVVQESLVDSLNVENLGSFNDLSQGNPGYRSEGEWSHNLGGFSELNMIQEESKELEDLEMKGNELESGVSLSVSSQSNTPNNVVSESGISVSNVESFQDDLK